MLYLPKLFWGNDFEMRNPADKSATKWRLDELIAFECAMAADEREDWSTLRQRDAQLKLEPETVRNGSRRQLAKSWLEQRLEQQPEIKLAAESIGHALKAAGQLLCVVALLSGLGAATAALAYNGEAPINVSAFFSVFVLLQAVMALVLLLVFVLPRGGRETMAFGPLFRLGRWLLEAIFSRTQALASRFLSGQQRVRASEIAGEARRAFLVHGSVAKWMTFGKIQAAALFFNAGALIALLVAVVFSDRAFGWQTTLEVPDTTILTIVETVAWPWSAIWGSGEGYPNLAQIEGSKIVLKEGIRGLANQDLAAWWRFLALGIATYGVLPRLLFWILGKWQTQSSLNRYDFQTAAVEQLLQRILPEAVPFEAELVERVTEEEREGTVAVQVASDRTPPVRCLCSRELGEIFNLDELRDVLANRWNTPLERISPRLYENGKMAEQTDSLAENEQVAVVFESWMPPIKEVERQVHGLRESLDNRCLIKIVLLGIPSQNREGISLKPEAQYAEAWHSFVRRLGDPYLVLENPAV